MKLSILVLSAFAVFIGSCSNSTESVQGGGGGLIFHGHSWDSAYSKENSYRISTSFDSLMFDFSGPSVKWGGKDHALKNRGEKGFYIATELNGDFSMGDSTGPGYEWLTYPISSHVTISGASHMDTVYPDGTHRFDSWTRSYVGTEYISLGGRAFTAVKVREDIFNGDWQSPSNCNVDSTTTYYWYINELGFFGKWIRDERYQVRLDSSYSGWQTVDTMLLIRYPVK